MHRVPPADKKKMSRSSPRPAADILADLQKLDRENDRLELRVALARQSLKAAEACETEPNADSAAVSRHLATARARLRPAG